MYYVIQENLFREYGFKALIAHLEKQNLGYEIVKYIPFSGELDAKTDRKDVFFFGSSNAGMVAKEKYDWKPGHFINENFTFEKYLPAYGKNLLNGEGRIVPSTHEFPHNIRLFVRPVDDGKDFTGELFTGLDWKEYIEGNEQMEGKKILIATPKLIQQEIRCWMIDGEPVTISQYKIGSRVNYLNMDHNDEAIIFARQMAKIYQPARAFCLDICLYEDEYKIVELGCINHCGFYDANMGKLIDALENMPHEQI